MWEITYDGVAHIVGHTLYGDVDCRNALAAGLCNPHMRWFDETLMKVPGDWVEWLNRRGETRNLRILPGPELIVLIAQATKESGPGSVGMVNPGCGQ